MSDLARAAAGYTVRDIFRRAFRIYADRVAVAAETGRWTYAELGERSERLAAALHGLGLRKGDRVAVLSETRPEYVETYAALARLGVTALTLNIRLHPRELGYCIETGKPAALLTSGPLAGPVREIRAGGSTIRSWVCFDGAADGYLDYAQLLADPGDPPPEADVGAGDVHNVLYTSGTTGRPKGAMISHGAAAVRGLRLAQWFGLGPQDGFIGWLPLFHCGGDESLYATMITGGTLRCARPTPRPCSR